jgi:hypothetical protein
MCSFSLFCTESRAAEIVAKLQEMGLYVTAEESIGGRTHFEVDSAPVEGEPEELNELRAHRAVISVLEDYASDR